MTKTELAFIQRALLGGPDNTVADVKTAAAMLQVEIDCADASTPESDARFAATVEALKTAYAEGAKRAHELAAIYYGSRGPSKDDKRAFNVRFTSRNTMESRLDDMRKAWEEACVWRDKTPEQKERYLTSADSITNRVL